MDKRAEESYNITRQLDMSPWSSGQDAALSRLNQGFDSPRRYQESWKFNVFGIFLCLKIGRIFSFITILSLFVQVDEFINGSLLFYQVYIDIILCCHINIFVAQ